ncbi:MAG: hypothetical protein QW112_00835 [Candidatus Micrarchaeia archaeon]
MGMIKNIFLALISLVFVADLTIYVALSSVKDSMLSADFYTGIFERNGVYAKVQSFVIDSISMEAERTEEMLGGLITQDEMRSILKESITVAWIKSQIDGFVRNLVIYFTTDAQRPVLTLSLADVKPRIVASLNSTLQAKIPPSAKNQTGNQSLEAVLPKLLVKCGSFEACMTYCQENPADEDCLAAAAAMSEPGAQTLLIVQMSEAMIASIPDSYDVYASMSPQDKVQLSNAKTMIKQFNLLLTGMLVVAVVLAIIIVAIAGIGNLKSICRWLGSPLLITGALLVVAGIFVPGMVMKMIPTETFKAMGAANAAFVQIILTDALRTIFGSVMTKGLIILGAGIVLLGVSLFISKTGNGEEKSEKRKR